ncbi:M15 family metallopeptidase [Glaciihabitans sp. INWT7]|uniref:M15 family metallopeptidase n=1 Tax=Glaciihabitans sp. INWT7 TaxID=2596912 RepID=UPI002105CDAE|nr:M15 family metallopeptidase [Glaciihabitans sp. INWT7]
MTSRRVRPVIAALVALSITGMLGACAREAPTVSTRPPSVAPSSPEPSITPTATPTPPGFDKAALSIDDPNSIWVVADKLRPLNPLTFVPPDLIETPVQHLNPPTLRAEAANAIVTMFAAAKAEGAGGMQLQSAYRSYTVQVKVYNGYVASAGKAGADSQSARPGFSEHQSGLAADISAVPLTCALAACFGQTPQGIWLAANAYRFGFVLRYPADKTAVTGYIYEPWHFRYVGVALATEMKRSGVTTLEEFFGLPAAPTYAP